MNKKISLFIAVLILLSMGSISFSFADPVNPPPPPPVTSYTYSLSDEFRSCGPDDNYARFCNEYYAKQKVVVNSQGQTIENSQSFVCGKDPRCEDGESCEITNPNDNNKWQTVELEDDWICENGFGLASLHQPGELDPKFDTISFSSESIDTQSIAFRSNTSTNLYFNSYIPACVNRIPMMNFNPELKNNDDEVVSDKTGLYAKHETLSYDANPTGGKLEEYDIPQQQNYKESYTLESNLKSYRMWSFRERFVEGLQKTINEKNLQIPQNIDVDSLESNTPQNFDEIYFSRDYMLGSFQVDQQNNAPVGESLTQELNFNCNLDVNNLSIDGINTNDDLEDYLEDESGKNRVITELKNNPSLCNLDEDNNNVIDVEYESSRNTVDTEESSKTITIDIEEISSSRYDNALEFRDWANIYTSTLSSKLRQMGELSRDPRESVDTINSIDFETTDEDIDDLEPEDFDFDCEDGNASCLADKIDSLGSYSSFSKELDDEDYIDSMYLIKEITSINENDDTVSISAELYTREVDMDLEILTTTQYDGFAQIKLTSEIETTTESSWNWRSLESLTLTQLSKCLYNWNECLLNSRSEDSVSWGMNEVADLGYGPVMDSMAYTWSEQTLESDYGGLNYGYHFDGARGSNTLNTPMMVYKQCESGDNWISGEGYYACDDGFVYKCHYGISVDEMRISNVVQANFGNTVEFSTGEGYVCRNSPEGAKWDIVACYQ